MSEHDFQDRTEQATPRRLQEAKRKGQVLRSKDLSTAIFMCIVGGLLLFTQSATVTLGEFFQTFWLEYIRKPNVEMLDVLMEVIEYFVWFLFPFFLVAFLVAMGAHLIPSGWVFSTENIKFKVEKLNPLKGLKRMFNLKSLFELIKSFMKFAIIMTILWLLIMQFFSYEDLFVLGDEKQVLLQGISQVFTYLFMLILGLFVIALIDVPIQFWDFTKQMRMTKQEVKDEMKETEGKPEVKAQVKKLQREYSNKKMMQDVKKADVVIINPTHYSVALRYQDGKDAAPVVVAKGVELVALQIRKVAKESTVNIVSSPKLTRALYYSTKIGHPIPTGLYVATAQVLAYVYQLSRYKRGMGDKPSLNKSLPIPDEFKT